ncbi:non-hydrolyzing UDP-N-acetylglucosamine 2-epimerase [Methanobrevibacter wolinii]|uniref:non-hydrolyzing UDP-N-acetylglucosamine 2-epimerase n=1 Tax=Methanobrevibacter wolinii TaxID=190977 RepID=UPI0005B29477|nr:UDP-N-acetylglucosamine 2-epimerase (non-hydrolyzing) [Methanobrevibacter wolinii]
MKIGVILGTRPEIIKMAPVIDEIQDRGHELLLIHTGQHYDKEMSENFFIDLELPKPNYNIHVGSGSHGKQTGLMMKGIEEVLIDEKPDIILVQGDTNAVLAGALVAQKLHIPVGHVEAGLRSFDVSMPEEINRMAADDCSYFYFVPTEESAINLILEGYSPKDIFITGNSVVDTCYRNLKIAKKTSTIIDDLGLNNLNNIITLTMHRAENVDDKERLHSIISALHELKDFNIVFPIHPRTKKTLEKFGLYDDLANEEHIHITKPIGYLDFLVLISKSIMILTDSGGLQEEAITLDVPALTLRYNTERPETVEAGGNILVGADKDYILKTASKILNDKDFYNKMKNAKNPYGNGNAASQMLDIIEDAYNKDNLKIESPETIYSGFKVEMKQISEDITVKEFEDKYNTLVRVIYKEDKMVFPQENTNIKDSIILFNKYNN